MKFYCYMYCKGNYHMREIVPIIEASATAELYARCSFHKCKIVYSVSCASGKHRPMCKKVC